MTPPNKVAILTLLLSLGPSVGGFAQGEGGEPAFDLVLSGGRIIDGTGNPWYRADVGIRDGRIAAIGRLGGVAAERRIDVTGRLVVPGFIDLHSHADGLNGHRRGLRSPDPERRAAPNLVTQGATTLVVNQDGSSPPSIAEQRATLERLGFGPNVVLMVGHNTIRRQAMASDFKRAATDAELDRMLGLLRDGMAAGASGMTAGLEYVPGRWSTTREMVTLVRALAPLGGVYIVHERASGSDPMWHLPSRDAPGPPTMLENIAEVIEVAERSGVPTVATHIKIKGADYWGSSGAIVSLVDRARARGVEVWLDQYPYRTTGSDGRTVLIPQWALEVDRWGEGATLEELAETDEESAKGSDEPVDYGARLESVLADPEARAALERDVEREITRRGGPGSIVVFEHPDPSWVGRSLAELSRELDLEPVELAFRLQREGFRDRPGGARLRGFSLAERDIETLAARPYTATASDAGVALDGDGPVHARFYGTFPRKIRHYALEREALSVEDAVRSATSLPAQILGLRDRGLVREGLVADLAVLDLERLRDRATFAEPHQQAEGVELVLIAGEAVVEGGVATGALAGRILVPAASRRPR